jgi:hypothetical protein
MRDFLNKKRENQDSVLEWSSIWMSLTLRISSASSLKLSEAYLRVLIRSETRSCSQPIRPQVSLSPSTSPRFSLHSLPLFVRYIHLSHFSVYTHAHIYMYAHTHNDIYIYIHTYIYIHVYIYIYISSSGRSARKYKTNK